MTTKPTKSSKSQTPTTSGIQTLATGHRVIPSSLRSDGTLRPERRVKPGFTPAEDVAKYQNRTAEAFRTRGSGGVPGATEVVGSGTAATSGGKKKRSRKKKAGGEAGGDDDGKEDETEEAVVGDDDKDDDVDEVTQSSASDSIANLPTSASTVATTSSTTPSTAADTSKETEKKAKAIQKKIRQAQELKLRRENGEALLPEQLEKALKLNQLIKDLEKLGISSTEETT